MRDHRSHPQTALTRKPMIVTNAFAAGDDP
jgi:hypothetical protein